jgi:hypothetical protein
MEDIMGKQHVIPLDDITKLSETIVSIIQVCEGSHKTSVSKSWSGDTASVVERAIANINVSEVVASSGITEL